MIDQLISFDRELLLMLNGSDSAFLDGIFLSITRTGTWIPLFLCLLYVVIKNNNTRRYLILLGLTVLLVVVSDRFSSGLCKPFFHRLRPSHDPSMEGLVDLVNNHRSGIYSFISGHATNTFAIAFYFSLIFRNRLTTVMMFTWAVLSSYSRIYLGLHYPGDILAGAVSGSLIGSGFYYIYQSLARRYTVFCEKCSCLYTSSGYMIKDLRILQAVFLATLLYTVIYAVFFSYGQ
jgi:undecaprenyl-diphosphatase